MASALVPCMGASQWRFLPTPPRLSPVSRRARPSAHVPAGRKARQPIGGGSDDGGGEGTAGYMSIRWGIVAIAVTESSNNSRPADKIPETLVRPSCRHQQAPRPGLGRTRKGKQRGLCRRGQKVREVHVRRIDVRRHVCRAPRNQVDGLESFLRTDTSIAPL